MNRTSANLLLKGKAEIRSIGDPCDASCAMWFACQNSTPNGICKGFVLLDGKSKDILRKNMREDDLIYLGNCTRTIQNGCTPRTKEALTQEVYRYLKPINDILRKKQERMPNGFRATLDVLAPDFKAILRNKRKQEEPEDFFKAIIAKHFQREEPDLHAKATTYLQQPFTSFLARRPREPTQPTNQELQERYKKRKQEE